MSKILAFLIFTLLFSCSKEKRRDKFLAGSWSIVTYSEFIYDGTTNRYDLLYGEARFDRLKQGGEANFELNFKAVNSFDTVERVLKGTYKRLSLDTLQLTVDTNRFVFDIVRIFKTDLNLQGGLAPDRKSVFIMKKKK